MQTQSRHDDQQQPTQTGAMKEEQGGARKARGGNRKAERQGEEQQQKRTKKGVREWGEDGRSGRTEMLLACVLVRVLTPSRAVVSVLLDLLYETPPCAHMLGTWSIHR